MVIARWYIDAMGHDHAPERTAEDFAKMSFAELAAESDLALFGKPDPFNPTPEDLEREEARQLEEREHLARRREREADYRRRSRPTLLFLLALIVVPPSVLAVVLVVVLVRSGGTALEPIFGAVIGPILGVLIVVIWFGRDASSTSAAGPAGSWRAYEHRVAQALRTEGESNVRVGKGRGDGGVDVETARLVVQVKDWSGKVGAPAVQQIAGVAAARGKKAVVVSRSGFTPAAKQFARQAGVSLRTLA